MVLVWRDYRTDIGNTYPFLPLSVRQLNQVSTDIEPLNLLTVADAQNIIEIDKACSVPGLSSRQIIIFASDDAIFAIDYYRPFNQTLYNQLSSSLQVRAFEFVGEKIKYSRLRRMITGG